MGAPALEPEKKVWGAAKSLPVSAPASRTHRFAACWGDRVLVQLLDGGRLENLEEHLPGYRVVECARSGATVVQDGRIIRVSRRGDLRISENEKISQSVKKAIDTGH